MLGYSRQHGGLFPARKSLEYVWKFGPTAVMTILVGFWTRVELQARRYMPWIALRQAKSTDEADFSLDYTSMMLPTLIAQSSRRKHYLVLCTTAVSLLLKVQIVLVPGLYRIARIEVSHPTDVRLLDIFNTSGFEEFNDDFSKTQYNGGAMGELDLRAYYISQAIHNFTMRYPFGVAKEAAYQLFEPRGSTDMPISTIVDGLFTDMQCLKLDTYSTPNQSQEIPTGRDTFDRFYLSLDFEGCHNIPHQFDTVPLSDLVGTSWDRSYWTYYGLEAVPGPARPCPNLPGQFRQLIFHSMTLEKSPKGSAIIDLTSFAAVICSQSSWTSKVEISDNGTSVSLKTMPNQPRTPFNVSIWSMIENSIPLLNKTYVESNYRWPRAPVGLWLQVEDENLQNHTFAPNTTEALHDAMVGLTRRLGPFVGHYNLRHGQHGKGETNIRTYVNRLTVNCQLGLPMIAIFALLTTIVLFSLLRYRRDTLIGLRDPATILGNILFFHSDRKLFAPLKIKRTSAEKCWSDKGFVPCVLRTSARTLFTSTVLSMIAALIVTLRKSETYDGITAAEGSWYLLWTSLPTLIILGVPLYSSSHDTSLRGMSPLYFLSTRPCRAQQLDIAILDMLGIRALLTNLRQRVWSLPLSHLLALICAFLTTIASTLFTVKSAPTQVKLQLQHESWFGDRALDENDYRDEVYKDNRASISSLLFRRGEEDITYPKNTYGDLVFPLINDVPPPILGTAKNVTIEITMPAATLHRRCETAAASAEIALMGFSTGDRVSYTTTCPNGSLTEDYEIFERVKHRTPEIETDRRQVCFDRSREYPNPQLLSSLSELFMWSERNRTTQDFVPIQAWTCHYSWAKVLVTTNMVMVNGEFVIDHAKPPRPDKSTITSWDPPFSFPYLDRSDDLNGHGQYSTLGSAYPDLGQNSQFTDDAFGVLVPPYGQIPLEAFRDPEQSERIIEALAYNRALLSAQLINIESRLSLEEHSSTNLSHGHLAPLDAVLTNHDTRRLVQNPIATYLLLGILGFVAMGNLLMLVSTLARRYLGWKRGLLDMDVKGLAPDGFSSIAMMAALLQPSNVGEHLPSNAEALPRAELYEKLSGLRFRLGWFRRESDQTRHFTIGVLDDDGFKFLGNKKDLEKESELEKERRTDLES